MTIQPGADLLVGLGPDVRSDVPPGHAAGRAEAPPRDGASSVLRRIGSAAEGCRPRRGGRGVVVERVAARVDGRAGGGHEVPAADLELGHRANERNVDDRGGQRDAALGALPAGVDLERDLVAIDRGDGPIEDLVEGRQVRRVVDQARGHSATGGRVLGRGWVRGDGTAGGRRGAEAGPEGDRERDGTREGEATDHGERAAGRWKDGTCDVDRSRCAPGPSPIRGRDSRRARHPPGTGRQRGAGRSDRVRSACSFRCSFPCGTVCAPHISRCPARVQIFQVFVGRVSGERGGEAFSGSIQADGYGVRGDPEDRGDLLIAQLFPGDEAQEFLVGGREGGQGGECGAVVVLAGTHRGRDVLDAEQGREPFPTAKAAAMVGQDPPRDGVQPRERLFRRDGVDLAPGDREGLGGHILGVGEGLGRRIA